MKQSGLLHSELTAQIAALGHTQSIVIGDAGLPIPHGVPVIDLAVIKGIPAFMDVLSAVLSEGVFESAIIASEIDEKNPEVLKALNQAAGSMPLNRVPHTQFKALCQTAQCIVRTGEATPYANIILIGGVNF